MHRVVRVGKVQLLLARRLVRLRLVPLNQLLPAQVFPTTFSHLLPADFYAARTKSLPDLELARV